MSNAGTSTIGAAETLIGGVSFQCHQVGGYVVDVFVGVNGQQIAMGLHGIVDFNLGHVAFTRMVRVEPSSNKTVTRKSSMRTRRPSIRSPDGRVTVTVTARRAGRLAAR